LHVQQERERFPLVANRHRGDIMQTAEQIEREIVIAAPPERVWALLTQAEHLGAWLGDAGAEVDLRPGGALVVRWQEHGAVRSQIERLEPGRYLAWRWILTDGETPRDDNSTLVEFSLTPEGAGTRLRVIESGFHNLAIPQDQQANRIAENRQGWLEELTELQQYAQRAAA
jgi:uncharacterized protein YndB with AHSA1/START domain